MARIRNFWAGPQLEIDLHPSREPEGGGATHADPEEAESRTATPRGAAMDTMGLTEGTQFCLKSDQMAHCDYDLKGRKNHSHPFPPSP